jgi:hypothetical protein
MDLKRTLELSGLKVLAEEKQLNEGEKNVKIQVTIQTAGPGLSGDMVNFEGGPVAEKLAEILGIPEGWKMVKVGKGYGAYMKGEQLCIFADQKDFMADVYAD